MGPRMAARAPLRGASLPAMEASACTSSGWRSRAPQNRNDVTVRAPKPFVFSKGRTRNRKTVTVYGERHATVRKPGDRPRPKGHPPRGAKNVPWGTQVSPRGYTLKADPVMAKPSTLSSNSKPAVRGLWLRTYHL